ncbi:hypothetical protein [Candidatus Palauibacter sp.]|uniref:hypothetical protein n=1 Tax=Candidatus Palauibacter sp. TaxID=3101350 RepID=UPI003B0293E5
MDPAEAFTPFDREIRVVVVACAGRIRSKQIDLLARFERERPWVPVVLVTNRDPELAGQLLRVRVAAIVWLTELRTQLQPCLDAVRATWGLWNLSETFERRPLPPALGKALVHAVRAAQDRPFHDVKELARAVEYASVTLFRQFGARANGKTTLRAFLSGLSVLRVYELRRSGLSWKLVTRGTGLGRATMARRMKSWPGCTPVELERLAPDRLFAAFTAEHVRPILGYDPQILDTPHL